MLTTYFQYLGLFTLLGIVAVAFHLYWPDLVETVKGKGLTASHRRPKLPPVPPQWEALRMHKRPMQLNFDEFAAVNKPDDVVPLWGGDEVVVHSLTGPYHDENTREQFARFTVPVDMHGRLVEVRWLVPYVVAYGQLVDNPGWTQSGVASFVYTEVGHYEQYMPVMQTSASASFGPRTRRLNLRRQP